MQHHFPLFKENQTSGMNPAKQEKCVKEKRDLNTQSNCVHEVLFSSKKNEPGTFNATMGKTLRILYGIKKSQTEKDKHCMIPSG